MPVDKGVPHRGQIENEYDTLFPHVPHILFFAEADVLSSDFRSARSYRSLIHSFSVFMASLLSLNGLISSAVLGLASG
jgi:hypothetical protein